jgi:diadenylate cyclase
LLVLLLATVISRPLHLRTLNWILDRTLTAGLIAIPIVFWPELRRALEQIGSTKFLTSIPSLARTPAASDRVAREVTTAAAILSKNKIGALIVIERQTGLNEIVESGIRLEALVTSELLTNTFIPNTPLHDGAVIIRGERILAAGCYLPLSSNPYIDKDLGTRHRAAVGISEDSDALVVIVSEETGDISIAEGGKLSRQLDPKALETRLSEIKGPAASHVWHWRPGSHE